MEFDEKTMKEFEKYSNKRKEMAKKMEKAIDNRSFEALIQSLDIKMHLNEILKQDTEIIFTMNGDSAPCISLHCSRHMLALAIVAMMNYNDDFYDMLSLICRMKELEEVGIINQVGETHKCQSKEELHVMREMLNKSPEEVEKLKKELEK